VEVVYGEYISRNTSGSTNIDEFLNSVNYIPDQYVQELVEDRKKAYWISTTLQVLLFPLFGWLLTRTHKSNTNSFDVVKESCTAQLSNFS